MEPIKISVDVNVNFSESVKSFLSGIFSQTTSTVVSEPAKPVQKVPMQSAQPAKTQATAKPAQSVPVAPAHGTPASSTIKIDQVRKALSEKVNDHRSAIKAKLEELGAPSVTKLDPSKYEDMYNFLTAL